MLTVSILINGQPLYTRSCFREEDGKYRVDDGSIIEHKYNDGAIVLAHKLLDTMYELQRKEKLDKIITPLDVLRNIKKENKDLKAENEKLKEWLENKEKAYNHLCDANNRKKEQIKNLNYMLFEEKEMTTQEWKLKYRLANKERKFIQYKEITNKKLNDYKQALEEIRKLAELEVIIFDNKPLFSTNIQRIIDKIDEVLN